MENLNQRIDPLVLFRKVLHQNPELSGKEFKTAERIITFLKITLQMK